MSRQYNYHHIVYQTTEYIIGKHISDAVNIKNSVIANYLKMPPVKLHCSMLAEDSVKLAIQNYNEHRKK